MKPISIALATLALGSIAFAQTSEEKAFKAKAQAEENAAAKMLMKKDAKGFTAWIKPRVTPDFVYIEAGQKQNFDTFIKNLTMGMQMMKTMTKAEGKVNSVKKSGSNMIAKITRTSIGTMAGQDGKPHKMAFVGDFTETYVMKNGKWLISKMEVGKSTMTMDGKPMSM